MAIALYLEDCYKKEFQTTVVSVKDDRYVVLEHTAFYPNMGGQPFDIGKLVRGSEEFPVVFVGKFADEISHEVSKAGLKPGDQVLGIIDWQRRHLLMRYHTAAHVLARVIHDATGAFTSGNQLGLGRSRIDFTLENFDREKIPAWIEAANEIVQKALPVTIGRISRDEALQDSDFSAPSKHLMPEIEQLRVISITGFDKQACGGTHLRNTSEIGRISFAKAENKGKHNRRIYFTLS